MRRKSLLLTTSFLFSDSTTVGVTDRCWLGLGFFLSFFERLSTWKDREYIEKSHRKSVGGGNKKHQQLDFDYFIKFGKWIVKQ